MFVAAGPLWSSGQRPSVTSWHRSLFVAEDHTVVIVVTVVDHTGVIVECRWAVKEHYRTHRYKKCKNAESLKFNAINTFNAALEKIMLDYWYWCLLEPFAKIKCTQLDSKDQARSPWLKVPMRSIENHNAHCTINGANTKHKKDHNVDQWKAWCECFEQRGHCQKNMWTLHRQRAHCQCVALSLPAHYICLSLKV